MKTFGSEWKQRLRDGEFLVGGHIFLPNPALAEAMVHFGYKYIWVDGEHGAFDKEQFFAHITAINGAGGGAFVRVIAGDQAFIKPVLEMGPDGIIIPMVNSAEEAAKVISACLYPPSGTRGFGPRRANRYGMVDDQEYLGSIDGALVKLIQVEHMEAVRNIDEILDVQGIDGVVIGPYDLSGSLGLMGQLRHPEVVAHCEKVIASCKKYKIPVGPSIGPSNDDYIKFWLERNIDFVFCGDEMSFAQMGATATLAKIEALRKS